MTIRYYIAGVDEAGRGPLAGPVVASAVLFAKGQTIIGVADSKKLSATRREQLYDLIMQEAISVGVGEASVEEIDEINILQASLLAMQRAVMNLSVKPDHVLIDGNRCPKLPYPATAIIGGDAIEPAISAASIIAKVTRDRTMCLLDPQYPQYGFAQHKGYGTQMHMNALQEFGITPIHRKTFAPVTRLMELS